jgi:hypothetical protein
MTGIFARWLATLSFALLAACVTGQKVDVPPAYKLGGLAADKSVEGVVAMSLKLNINEIDCDSSLSFARCRFGIYVLRQDGPNEDGRDGLEALNPFQVDANEEGLYGPATYIAGPLQPRKDMLIWKLPAGSYRIWSWYLHWGNGSISPKDYPELYDFQVVAGEVTYAGRLNLNLDIEDRKNMTFGSTITDESAIEHAKVLEVFPQFADRICTRLITVDRLN